MKVIDQINGSALFAQSAYSAAIATKDSLGRDITATYLTGVDLGDYATKNEVSSYILKSESGVFQPSGNYLSSNALDGYATQQWVENQGYLTGVDLSNYYQKNETSSKSEIENALTSKLETTAFTAWSASLASADYELSAGSGIALVDDAQNKITRIDFTGTSGPDLSAGEGIAITTNGGKTIITNNISAGPGISMVYDVESNKIRIDGEGREYTGVAPINVNNSTNEISISGESLSAGPNIDLFESGGYVVISANGGNKFPITGAYSFINFTANMDCSSVLLSTASFNVGGYVKQTVNGVQCVDSPNIDVSAGWYNIITATNNRSNCYCIRFTNDMTAVDLANYSAYDKVTVVHSNEYAQDCHLYWNGNTKVFPSGLYCELVKGTNDQNQIDWFFTTSGWTNNLWWDWD